MDTSLCCKLLHRPFCFWLGGLRVWLRIGDSGPVPKLFPLLLRGDGIQSGGSASKRPWLQLVVTVLARW